MNGPKKLISVNCGMCWVSWLLSITVQWGIFSSIAQAAPTVAPVYPNFAQVLVPRTWAFPADHGRHDGYKTEWWYYSGNLRDPAGRRFGYQLTFFRIAVTGWPTTLPASIASVRPVEHVWSQHDLYFAHAAVSDLDGKQFVFKDLMQRGRPGLAESADDTLNVYLHDWRAKLDDSGSMILKAGDTNFAIDLTAGAGLGPVLQGPGGVSAKGPTVGQASYYYSEPQMPTRGTLTVGTQSFPVTGNTWMDHEFSSNALGPDQVGWDWIALSFADRSSLMLYRIRNKSASLDYTSGTLISPDGTPRYLTASQIQIESSHAWHSAKSDSDYPQQWRLVVPDHEPITVKAMLDDQELRTPETTGVNYFEGAVEATDDHGHHLGEGYLEMTGYSKAAKSPLENFFTFFHIAREIWGTS